MVTTVRALAVLIAGAAACGAPKEPSTPADMARACASEHLPACIGLAYAYSTGRGVPEDPAQASQLYDHACRGGLVVGCVNLGVAYAQGAGVPQDLATARGLFERACASGPRDDVSVPVACVDQGVMLQLGLGQVASADGAQALYRRACAAAFVPGCEREALLLWDQDRPRAQALLEQACAAGHGRSCQALEQARAGRPPEPDHELLFARVNYYY
jgi:TPR repeat protein